MCGKRLKDWKTIPIPRRTCVHVDARGGDLLAAHDDPSGVDRLEQVHAAQERRLPRARSADEADDLVLGELEVDPAQHLELAERLVHALERELRRSRSPQPPASCRRLSRATSQSVNRASGIVISDEEDRRADVRRVVEASPATSICDWRNASTTPSSATSAVSFWSPMKSLRSGGITRRTACGHDDVAQSG